MKKLIAAVWSQHPPTLDFSPASLCVLGAGVFCEARAKTAVHSGLHTAVLHTTMLHAPTSAKTEKTTGS